MMFRLNVLLIFACAATLIAVLFRQPAPETSLPVLKPVSPTNTPAPEPVAFQDISLDWQVVPLHQQTSEHLSALTETLGSGICAIDINRDGWMDLFFVGGSGHTRHYGKKSWWHRVQGNRLLLNKQGHHFEDVTERAGLQKPIWGMACAVADLNNDGFHDLIVTGVGANRIFKNNGDTTFSDVTAESGIISDHWSVGASLADFDGDGLVDLYISNYILFRKGARTFERTSGFRTTVDVAFDQTLYDPEPNRLYRNSGGFKFEEVTEEMGVANSLGRSLGAKWFDINGDKWPDLLVINDHNTPNQLFINEQGKSFSRGGDRYAPFEIAGAHDVAINDFDNDSNKEFFMSRGMGHPPVLLNYDANQHNFTDTAWSRGVAQARLLPFSGWASTAADFNNDGFLDLYVANGATLPDIDSHFVPQAQTNSLFINDGKGGFVGQPPTSEPQHPYSSRGVVSIDLDNDGQLEIIVSNNNDPLQIFKNSASSNNWLVLDLDASYHDAEIYGAQLSIKTGFLTINRSLLPPQHFLSQSDRRVHIGLGKSSKVDELTIRWRNGSRSVFNDLSVNQFYSIDRESNTLKAQHYQVNSEAHFSHALSEYSDLALTNLARLLLNSSFHKPNGDDLQAIWRHSSTAVRNETLILLAEQWENNAATPYLSIIKQALSDQDSEIRIHAIKLLKNAELETSVVWLIPLLNDREGKVQCAATEAFRFFFDEEEAVTHRKMLAISPLIKLLETGSPEARICAADALAAAENKRAVLPLMHQARQHHVVAVRAAAIRALGLIRDTEALPLLHQLVRDRSSEASIVALGLIALSRLTDPLLNEIFNQVFNPNTQNQVQLYDTLYYLFSTPGGAVFPKAKLVTILQQAVNRDQQIKSGQADNPAAIAALRAVGAAKSPIFEKTVLSFVNSVDNSITEEALIALASLNTAVSSKRFELLLLKQPPSVIDNVLKHLGNSYYGYSSRFVVALFKEPETSRYALSLLQSLPNNKASTLFSTLLHEKLSEEQQMSLLEVCTLAALIPTHADDSLWSHSSPEMRLRAVDCFLQHGADSGSSDGEQANTLKHNLVTHRILGSFLSDPHWDGDTKTRMLVKASSNNALTAKTLLVKQIGSLPEKWLPSALDAINSAGDTPSIEGFLWKLYQNVNRSTELRLQAAVLLADLALNEDATKSQKTRTQVMEYLYQMLAEQ